MSGRKKSSRRGRKRQEEEEQEVEETEGEEETEEEEEVEEALPQLTKAQQKELFKEYQKSVDALEELKAAIGTAEEARSQCVAAIYENLGTGPFRWKGQKLRPKARKRKGSDDEYLYFMTVDNDEVQDIG